MHPTRPFSHAVGFLLFAALLTTAPAGRAASVAQIRFDSKGDYSRFVAEFNNAFSAPRDYNQIFEHSRFYIDVQDVEKGLANRALPYNDDLIQRIETIYYPEHRVQRFLFYLNKKAPYEVTRISNPERLVVDVLRDGKVMPGRPTPAVERDANSLAALHGLTRRKVVVVDPGHGGAKSPGAVSRPIRGIGKVREKDVVLKIAFELEDLLRQSRDMKCVLTRRTDAYVSLAERRRLSKLYKADVFLSIHCNAASRSSRTARGVEFFYLSERGKSRTADLMSLEALENDAAVNGSNGHKPSTELEKLLHVMSESRIAEYASESRKFCEIFDKHFRTYGYSGFQRYNRGVKRANFEVLRQGSPRAGMLLEVGFLSNSYEARQLADPAFQRVTAKLIFNALNEYFAERDPEFKAKLVALK